ncbi:hypothetical protein Vafri_22026 [Volvox africanus]|uniref:Tubulin-folding cofactor D C-terminal domain-containing protein n=1 Tax=Volvox africanus TaxID=51714 RepID=A0A8J4BWT7_9CHLO|nr:hypothetical protein Vafri_22026 [Volvox africanus]
MCTQIRLAQIRHGAVIMVAELLPALAANAAAAATAAAAAATADTEAPSLSPTSAGSTITSTVTISGVESNGSSSRATSGWPLSPERQAAVAELVPAIDKARLYRGKGGEVMREAVARLVEGCSTVGLVMSSAQHAKVLEALDENLRHPQQYIQAGAVAAVRAYAKAYLINDPRAAAAFRTRYLDAYLTRLHDANVAVRRGYSLALGSLPAQLLRPVLEEAVDALVDGCVPEDDPDERDVDSRVNCTKALGQLLETMALGPCDGIAELLRDKILPCLHASLEDYTTDNRGDVGSWLREAAMRVLAMGVGLLPICYSREGGNSCSGGDERSLEDLPSFKEWTEIAVRAVGTLLRQSVERIGRVRECALRHLRTMMSNIPRMTYIPAAARVNAAVLAASDAADAGGLTASLEALHCIVVRLLSEPAYTKPLLEGLVASIGGIDNSLAKVASAALLEALAEAPSQCAAHDAGTDASGSGQPPLLKAVTGHLLDIWSRYTKSSRLATPLLRIAVLLITKAPDVAEVRLPRPPPPQAAVTDPECTTDGSSMAPSSRFVDHLVEAVRAETRGCADVARLVDAGSLLCHLVAYGGHCRTSALQGLMVLLISKYPKVRRNAAEQLYLQLLALGTSDPAPATLGTPLEQVAEAACDLLLSSPWDGELEAAKAARDELAALVGVTVPKMKAPAAATGRMAAAAVQDENASYQALLDDFARGY